jgi:hypothetical protein
LNDVQKRLVAAAIVAAAIGAWLLATFTVPWFYARLGETEIVLGPFGVRGESNIGFDINPWLAVVAMLSQLYFFGRLFFLGLLLLLGGPTTRKIAWYTPKGAHIQGAIVSALTIAFVAQTPQPRDVMTILFGGATFERGWGGALAIVALALAHLAIYVVARDAELSATQTWEPNKQPRRAKARQPRERPLVKAPLPPPPIGVEGDPFREPGHAPHAIKVVRHAASPEPAPRASDEQAPAPKLLT